MRLLWDRFSFPQWYVRTDASTSGLGGILLDAKGNPARWWAAPIPAEALSFLNIQTGEPGLMTVYELLGLLLSFIIWSPFLRKCRLGVMAQLDSESALGVAVKLASPHPKANLVAAELALRTEQLGIEAVLGQHWANPINIEADALSRLEEANKSHHDFCRCPAILFLLGRSSFWLMTSLTLDWHLARARGVLVDCLLSSYSMQIT